MSTNFNIPLGFRFIPSDVEIIRYLLFKITGTPLPGLDGLMLETDVFGESPPWELFDDTASSSASTNGDNIVRYFFTQLKKRNKNGSYFKRNVGEIGTWKGETMAVQIKDPKTRVTIGEKRSYTFKPNHVISGKRKRSRDDHGDDCKWLMMEYGLAGETLKYTNSVSDYVLCRIKKKKAKSQEQNQELPNNNHLPNQMIINRSPLIHVYQPQLMENDPIIININSSGYENNYNNLEANYLQVRGKFDGEFDGDDSVEKMNNSLYVNSTASFEVEGSNSMRQDNSEYVGNVGNISNDIYVINSSMGFEEEGSIIQDNNGHVGNINNDICVNSTTGFEEEGSMRQNNIRNVRNINYDLCMNCNAGFEEEGSMRQDNGGYEGNINNNDLYVNNTTGFEYEGSTRQGSAHPWKVENFSNVFTNIAIDDLESVDPFFVDEDFWSTTWYNYFS